MTNYYIIVNKETLSLEFVENKPENLNLFYYKDTGNNKISYYSDVVNEEEIDVLISSLYNKKIIS